MTTKRTRRLTPEQERLLDAHDKALETQQKENLPTIKAAAQLAGQRDRQSGAVRELRNFFKTLTPAHGQYFAGIHQAYGFEGVLRVLEQIQISPDAREVLTATYQQRGGFDGLVKTVEEELVRDSYETQQAEIQASIERAKPQESDPQAVATVKRTSPVNQRTADAEIQARAAELAAAFGITVKKGQSPHDAITQMVLKAGERNSNPASRAKMIHDLAKRTGESAKDIAALFGELEGADIHHGLVSRLAQNDKPALRLSPEASKRVRIEQKNRTALEEEHDRLAAQDEARGVKAAREAVGKVDNAPSPIKRRAALEAAFDDIDRSDPEAPVVQHAFAPAEPEPEEEEKESRPSVRSALSQRYDELEGAA